MTWLDVTILSFVEGITEFLPISSTGHLILTSKLLGIIQSEFVKTFEIVIQSGAITAVAIIYFKRICSDLELIKKILVAFIPTGVIGIFVYSQVKHYLIGNELITLIALFAGGIIIIVCEYIFGKRQKQAIDISKLSYKKAFLIGLCQSVSMIPGVSRSAASIIGSLAVGLKRSSAVEFSFMLAIPTMAAATGYDLLKNTDLIQGQDLKFLLLGFAMSFVVAYICVKWFLKFIQRYNFIPFGVYRIILATLFYLFVYVK